MKKIIEKVKAIYYIIVSKECLVYTAKTKDSKLKPYHIYLSKDSSKEFMRLVYEFSCLTLRYKPWKK